MRVTAENIWCVPAYLPYLQPPLTESSLSQAEEQIGHKLAAEYVELLRVQNGGHIRFSLPDIPNDTIAGIGPYFPSLTQFHWEECQEFVSFELQGLVPFDGDGHWHLCLDYRDGGSNPSVTYIDVECDHEGNVADSFAAYLNQLQIGIDDEFVLEGAGNLQEAAAVLAQSLGIVFEATDAWAHGYSMQRARICDENDPEWVWISPNMVPRGFARPDEARYDDLKDLMPGQSPRFPEIPEKSCLLDATPKVRAQVMLACEKSGFRVRPLREYFEIA